ncbi:MAG: hypothetical protein D3909_10145, partial [Candidatus Electrothrix sp. ATG1]|nr:hypothetical protein [Candidatus Electrothrix sp. ATG1]
AWCVGDTLSEMEKLCLASFQHYDHTVQLYVYEPPAGVPNGIELMDAEKVLPRRSIFKYKDRDTYAGFANLFRYKLLLEKGGIWIDMDMICLNPFIFQEPYVFASENPHGVTNSMIKVPPGAEVMQFCYDRAVSFDPRDIRWGMTGPALLRSAVDHFD